MKKLIFIVSLPVFLVGISSAFFVNNHYSKLVDKCCVIDLVNYKEKLSQYQKILHEKYPNLERQVDNYVYLIQQAINENPKFKKHKLNLYKKIINIVQDYVYNHNIIPPKPSYYMLAYFVYRIKDLYEYERNTKKYNLESLLENLDKSYGY